MEGGISIMGLFFRGARLSQRQWVVEQIGSYCDSQEEGKNNRKKPQVELQFPRPYHPLVTSFL